MENNELDSSVRVRSPAGSMPLFVIAPVVVVALAAVVVVAVPVTWAGVALKDSGPDDDPDDDALFVFREGPEARFLLQLVLVWCIQSTA